MREEIRIKYIKGGFKLITEAWKNFEICERSCVSDSGVELYFICIFSLPWLKQFWKHWITSKHIEVEPVSSERLRRKCLFPNTYHVNARYEWNITCCLNISHFSLYITVTKYVSPEFWDTDNTRIWNLCIYHLTLSIRRNEKEAHADNITEVQNSGCYDQILALRKTASSVAF
jgi:hypothetical protein